ncbi:YesL family protein [Sediminibacillus massiliensis]|uniref:YesL family protein n=1 Tax=Sediminibacillus massiliensis TaxID=1926277 RepID=UPI0009884D7D|nr:DUF624 domain-containing protein [Sediminibacillus massiliensis]
MKRVLVFADWLWEMLILQFHWFFYVVKGAFLFGIFPATAALYAVIRHWLKNGGKEGEIQELYKKFYKENFRNANISGWLIVIAGVMVYLNWVSLAYITNPVAKMALYGIIILFSVLILVIWLFLFPVLVHYQLSWLNYFILSLRLGFTYLPITLLQLFLLGICAVLLLNFPAISVLFGLTIIALLQTFICNYVFYRMDPQN